jgi:hypothetical protein
VEARFSSSMFMLFFSKEFLPFSRKSLTFGSGFFLKIQEGRPLLRNLLKK